MNRGAPDFGQAFMELAVQPIFDKGFAEGYAKGLAQAVLSVLDQRFNCVSVPDTLRVRIDSASAVTLRTWHKQLLIAATIEEVFGEGLDGGDSADRVKDDTATSKVVQVAHQRFPPAFPRCASARRPCERGHGGGRARPAHRGRSTEQAFGHRQEENGQEDNSVKARMGTAASAGRIQHEVQAVHR